MSGDASQVSTFGFLNKTQLTKLKKKAIRLGGWFTVLRRIDRAFIDLTGKVSDNARSYNLVKKPPSVHADGNRRLGYASNSVSKA